MSMGHVAAEMLSMLLRSWTMSQNRLEYGREVTNDSCSRPIRNSFRVRRRLLLF